MSAEPTLERLELDSFLDQVESGDPVGAAYRLAQAAGDDAPGRLFYEAGSMALERRGELGEHALRFARIAFEEAVDRDPDLGEAHHDLATAMRELGMASDAIAHYQRALELLPDDVDAMIGLGAALCDSGELEKAIETLSSATDQHPDNGLACANLGIALEAWGKSNEAIAAYAKAVARFDAALHDCDDEESATEAAARRRWARIQHAELLEQTESWARAIVEYRRLYEEEQMVAEAMEAMIAQEHEDEDEHEPQEGDMVQGVLSLETDVASPGRLLTDVGDEHDHPGDTFAFGDDDDENGEDAGRLGLERVFTRLVGLKKYDLAYVVLDDLGGEFTDARTEATYTVYDPGNGLGVIMVESENGAPRQRLDPQAMSRSE